MAKNLPAMWETQVWSLGQEDRLEKGMAAHSSVLSCRNPWTEEPGGLQSMGLQRVRHDWVTNTHTQACACAHTHKHRGLLVTATQYWNLVLDPPPQCSHQSFWFFSLPLLFVCSLPFLLPLSSTRHPPSWPGLLQWFPSWFLWVQFPF